MKTLLITKDDVLTAIETEPLLTAYRFVNKDTCAVCVVGGLLRQAGIRDDQISKVGRAVTELRASSGSRASRANWLSALSITWETLYEKNCGDIDSPEDLRWNIWEWAEENIPEDWEYELVVQGGVV